MVYTSIISGHFLFSFDFQFFDSHYNGIFLSRNYQKSKLKSVFRYFDLKIQNYFPISDSIVITRRVIKRHFFLFFLYFLLFMR